MTRGNSDTFCGSPTNAQTSLIFAHITENNSLLTGNIFVQTITTSIFYNLKVVF